jgi:hypothetical protein
MRERSTSVMRTPGLPGLDCQLSLVIDADTNRPRMPLVDVPRTAICLVLITILYISVWQRVGENLGFVCCLSCSQNYHRTTDGTGDSTADGTADGI